MQNQQLRLLVSLTALITLQKKSEEGPPEGGRY